MDEQTKEEEASTVAEPRLPETNLEQTTTDGEVIEDKQQDTAQDESIVESNEGGEEVEIEPVQNTNPDPPVEIISENSINVLVAKNSGVGEEEKIRAKLLSIYEEALQRKQILSQNNFKKQKAIMDYLRSSKKVGMADAIMDGTNRYLDLLLSHKDTRLRLEKLREKNDKLLDATKQVVLEKRQQVDVQTKQLYDNIIKALPEMEKSKAVQKEIIEEWIPKLLDMDHEIVKRRMEFLQSKAIKESLEQGIKEKEEFSKGLHLIDFEQLKMENASYSEKIEEKNEAIHKTKTKSTATIHILAHVKEKLLFVQNEKISLQKKLDELELQLNHHKSLLNQLKKDREELKHSNEVMKDDNPLIGSDTLLLDYENRKKEYIFYKAQLMEFRDKYEMLKEKNDLYLHMINKHQGLIKLIIGNGGMRAFDQYNQEQLQQKQENNVKQPVAPINLSLLNYERMLEPSYQHKP